jgi:hypothetical protein
MKPVFVLGLLTSCAVSAVGERPGPRGLRADQHLELADRASDRAAELHNWPDVRPGTDVTPGSGLFSPDQQGDAGAWYAEGGGLGGLGDTTGKQQENARLHRAEAGRLQADYEQACGQTPLAKVMTSPLQLYGIGGTTVPDGSLVLLGPEAGSPDHVLAAVRCHRAWLMLGNANATRANDDPFDLPGLNLAAERKPSGIDLTITVDNPGLVSELQRRAAHDLETAARLHHNAAG